MFGQPPIRRRNLQKTTSLNKRLGMPLRSWCAGFEPYFRLGQWQPATIGII